MHIRVLACWLTAALPLLACGTGEAAEPEALTGLRDLKNVEELQAQFNEDAGKPRIVLLVSPT